METIFGTMRLTLKDAFKHVILIAIMSLLVSGYLVIASIALTKFLFAEGTLRLLLGVSFFALVLFLFPLLYGLMNVLQHKLLDKKASFLSSFFEGFKNHFLQAIIHNLIYVFFIVLVIASWQYYSTSKVYFDFIFAVFNTYILFMVTSISGYMMPIAIKKEIGFRESLKLSISYFLKFPFYSFKSIFVLIILGAILAISVVGFAFVYFGFAMLFSNYITSNVINATESEI